MCHGGCGVLVHVKDGKVIKVQGDPASPLNRGSMCPKGLASIEQLYHPDRLKHPLKRAGKRGEGKWERISWEEALNTLASRIADTKAAYGPESIALGQGTGRYYFMSVDLPMPGYRTAERGLMLLSQSRTGIMTYGDLPMCDYGRNSPSCLLVWGHNPSVSGPDGEIQFRVEDCLRRGTRLIVIDPRKTEIAEKADVWLQVRPGTDDSLALSMINVIISEGLTASGKVDRV
jgi:anaerobic selenocysteine-containing dehydrogenase